MPEKIQYTDAQMRGDLLEITRQINHDAFDPQVIVGVARGGLVPATMLSHYYDAPLMALNISLRDDRVDHGHTGIDTLVQDIQSGRKILVVDDICDSGETLAAIQRLLEDRLGEGSQAILQASLRVAVLWNNVAQDVFEPNYVGREINRTLDERWVVFSFEEWWKL